MDEKNQGILEIEAFKNILSMMKFGTADHINKFTRYIEKDIHMNIDYYKFLNQIKILKTESELKLYTVNKDLVTHDDVTLISTRLANYLKYDCAYF